jgi:hypothetical protein
MPLITSGSLVRLLIQGISFPLKKQFLHIFGPSFDDIITLTAHIRVLVSTYGLIGSNVLVCYRCPQGDPRTCAIPLL